MAEKGAQPPGTGSTGAQKEGKVGASWKTCTRLMKWKITSRTDKQAISFLHADNNHLPPLLSISTPLTPSSCMCWLLWMGMWQTHDQDKEAQPFYVFAKLLLSKYTVLFQHSENHPNDARPTGSSYHYSSPGTLDLAVDMDADQWGSLIQTTPGSGVWWIPQALLKLYFYLQYTVMCELGRMNLLCLFTVSSPPPPPYVWCFFTTSAVMSPKTVWIWLNMDLNSQSYS